MTKFKKINFFIVQCADYAYAWRTAEKIAGNYLGRLAIVLMVLKAHCLNVTPTRIQVFKTAEDQKVVDTPSFLKTRTGVPAGFILSHPA